MNLQNALTSSEQNISYRERLFSLLSGTVLLGYSLYKRSPAALGSVLLSVALFDRAIRGHCAISQMMGRNTAPSAKQGPRPLEASYALTIARYPQDIEPSFGEPENLRKILEGGDIPEVPAERSSVTVASDGAFKHQFSGNNEADGEIRITKHTSNRLEWQQPGAFGSVDLQLAPGGRGTEVKVTVRRNKPIQFWQELAVYDARRKLRRGLRQLKQKLESGDIPTIVGQPSGRAGGRDLHGGISLAEMASLT